MIHVDGTKVASGEVVSPRPRSLAASLETALGRLIEIPAASLPVAEIVTLFAGVVSRYVLQRPLIWSDELASSCSCGWPCWGLWSRFVAPSTCV
jgi:hypothetical protein